MAKLVRKQSARTTAGLLPAAGPLIQLPWCWMCEAGPSSVATCLGEVFYFGGAVEELCLSCLARGRPDLAARALSVKATNLATWLRQAVCSKVGETLEAGESEGESH